MENKKLKNLILSAMFFALGIVLPFFTGQIQQIGNMLLPMHIPVFLCGLICGWKYGVLVGFLLPIVRSIFFSMPLFYPAAISMAFELATYGMVSGFVYSHSKWQCTKTLYKSLFMAMISGRIVWAMVQMFLLSIKGNILTMEVFITSAFLNAIPGILLQLVLIPAILVALDHSKIYRFKKENEYE